MTAVRNIVAVLCSFLLLATSFADAQIGSTTAPAPPPDILFLMADDWSSPYAGVLGDPVVKTPAFDCVAREGVLFANAFVSAPAFQTRMLRGWTVHVSRELLTGDAAATARALELLQTQLEEIIRVVPAAAVRELQAVPLWISPEYADTPPRAEYHPDARWLRRHGRDPAMARGVEFTNVRIFEASTRRMPNFTLHELAHAFHHRVIAGGFANEEIKAAYEKAKASGRYDRVERQDSEGRKLMDRAYAMTDPQEYFAESTEAFFSRNDFFPYNGDELKQHDPEMFALLTRLWGVKAKPAEPKRKTAAALQQAPVDRNHRLGAGGGRRFVGAKPEWLDRRVALR
jgi:hypothetical protein